MTGAEWLNVIETKTWPRPPEWLRACASDRKLRLFMVACCRGVPGFLWLDDNCIRAVTIAERYADGSCSDADLERTNLMMSHECADHPGDPVREATFRPTVKKAIEGVSLCPHYARAASLERDRGEPKDCFIRYEERLAAERMKQGRLACCILGKPAQSVSFMSSWSTDTVESLTRWMYESRDFSAMPILADALQDAGCDNADVLDHCRGPGPHVRGCWVVDLVLGKQ